MSPQWNQLLGGTLFLWGLGSFDREVIELLQPFVAARNSYVGGICRVSETDTDALINRLIGIFDIPFVAIEGKNRITTIAIVPGCGDVVDMQKGTIVHMPPCHESTVAPPFATSVELCIFLPARKTPPRISTKPANRLQWISSFNSVYPQTSALAGTKYVTIVANSGLPFWIM